MLLPFLLCMLILYLPVPDAAVAAWHVGAAGVALLAVLNGLMAWAGCAVARRLSRGAGERGALAAAQVFLFLKGLAVGLVLADVLVLGWPTTVAVLVGDRVWSGVAADLVLPLPAVVMVLTLLAFQHRFERRRRRVSLSLAGYLWLRFRVELAIVLVPWLALVAATDLVAVAFQRSRWLTAADAVASGAVLLGVVVLSPRLLRAIWHTSPLPAGPLRARLEEMCARLHFRCNDILVWHTHRHLANAGVVGPTPLLRYVLLTDALVQNCTSEQVAAVFAHEVGHVKRRHLPFYLVLGLGFICFYPVVVDAAALTPWVEPLQGLLSLDLTQGQAAIMVAFAAAYWGLAFGYVSRRMEREADLYAMEATGEPGTFLSAMGMLARMSSVPRGLASWRHFSLERRLAFIRQAMEDPSLGPRVLKRTWHLKVVVVTLIALAAARLLLVRPELLTF